jgi:UDP-2-acetamido-2,6-beta-L-arabino-hexul-4-ose reductase
MMVQPATRCVLVTGALGFIGRNLVTRLQELPGHEVIAFTRNDEPQRLRELVARADAVVHLAGENRPRDPEDFVRVNHGLTEALCEALGSVARPVPLVLASSTQAAHDNPYGRSKLAGEEAVRRYAQHSGRPAVIYRLPGVFGKWCRPNYNSVVATFCHNLARQLPIQVNDRSARLRLVYVDDVVAEFVRAIGDTTGGLRQGEVEPEYSVTLGELEQQLRAFEGCRTTLISERVGTGLVRALYATYVSYLPQERFSYALPSHGDARGVFVEMLKTQDSGQFSYFTAHPGITRGGHYHHSKTEKFLVIRGKARFGFRHLVTGERYELLTSGEHPEVVETIPGWTHDITNVGDDEMVVMLWANEVFDRERPDTIACKV